MLSLSSVELALSTLVTAPLLGACLAFALRPRRAFLAVAPALFIVALCAAVIVTWVAREGRVRFALGGWEAPLGITLDVGGPSALLLATNTVVMLAVSVYARAYLGRQQEANPMRLELFWPLWLLLLAGLNGLCLSGDLFNLYVSLEVAGLASVALVALAGRAAAGAALRYLLVSLLGSMLYLFGVALLYGETGVVDLARVGVLLGDTPAARAALVLTTLGLLLKTAIVPVHFWLPPEHSRALSPISAVLSALVVKGSFFVLLRLWLGIFADLAPFALAEVLGGLGAAAVVWGSLLALRQRRLKLLVAYSTVGQLGYLMLAFPLGEGAGGALAWQGALLFLISHAAAKAALFLAAGTLLHAFGTDDIPALRGAALRLPVTAFSFGLAGIAVIGLPPSGGFMGKWLLLLAAIEQARLGLAAIILIGSLLAAAYVFSVLARLFHELPDKEPPVLHHRPSLSMELTPLALSLIALFLGLLAAGPMALVAGDLSDSLTTGAAP